MKHKLDIYQNFLDRKQPKPGLFISNSTILFLAFASAFFPRALESLGAPSAINFLHFATVPLALVIILATNQNRDRRAINIATRLGYGLLLFFLVTLSSAMLNGAAIINCILNFLLLSEPFIFLIAIILVPMEHNSLTKIKKWFVVASLLHLFLALFQKYILKVETWHHLGMEGADRIQGIFFISGAGHVVGSAVSLSFSLYYLVTAKSQALWLRLTILLLSLWHLLVADAKQVLLAVMIAGALLFLVQLNDILKAIKFFLGGSVSALIFVWCVQNIPAFSPFTVWLRPEIYGSNGEATLLKTAAFRLVPDYYHSLGNWFLGLGPGHTVGRLGGWMLLEYEDLLEPLGSTRHEASRAVWWAVGDSWLGDQSSLFSPLFGWAGIWGDLGFVGLGVYLGLAFVVWQYVCRESITKLLLLSIAIFGCIFSQMEEPGYMLTMAFIFGLRWQELEIKRLNLQVMRYQDLGQSEPISDRIVSSQLSKLE